MLISSEAESDLYCSKDTGKKKKTNKNKTRFLSVGITFTSVHLNPKLGHDTLIMSF